MTSNMNISAKDNVYTIKVACNGELRRFSLSDCRYETLSAQVAQLFGVPNEGFVFQYVDDEGDNITMSSDIELRTAMEVVQGVLRLELIRKGEAKVMKATHHKKHSKHLHHGPRDMQRKHHQLKRWRRIIKLQKRLSKMPRGMRHTGLPRHCRKGLWAKMAMHKFARRNLEHVATPGAVMARPNGWRYWHHVRGGHGQQQQHFPMTEWKMLKMRKCFGRKHLWGKLAGTEEVAKRHPRHGCGSMRRFPRAHCGGMAKVAREHGCRRKMLLGKRGRSCRWGPLA